MTQIKGVLLAVNDLNASLLFYTELLGMEVVSYREGHVIFKEGLELYSLPRFSKLISKGETDMFFGSSQYALEFETIWFEKILLKANKEPFSNLEYRIFYDKGERNLILRDPDLNLIIIREKDDNTIKKYSDSEFEEDEDNSLIVQNTIVFEK